MIVSVSSTAIDMFGDSLMIFLHSNEPPSSSEIQPFYDYVETNLQRLHDCQILVLSDGGGPDAESRQRNKALAERGAFPKRTAVVSRSNILRFNASAVALFLRNLKVFEPEYFEMATAFLGFQPEDLPELFAKLEAMRRAAPDGARFKTLDEVLRSFSNKRLTRSPRT